MACFKTAIRIFQIKIRITFTQVLPSKKQLKLNPGKKCILRYVRLLNIMFQNTDGNILVKNINWLYFQASPSSHSIKLVKTEAFR